MQALGCAWGREQGVRAGPAGKRRSTGRMVEGGLRVPGERLHVSATNDRGANEREARASGRITQAG